MRELSFVIETAGFKRKTDNKLQQVEQTKVQLSGAELSVFRRKYGWYKSARVFYHEGTYTAVIYFWPAVELSRLVQLETVKGQNKMAVNIISASQ